MSSEHDLGDAASYIAAERPTIDEDTIWTVLNEVGSPPPRGAQDLAEDLVVGLHPHLPRRVVQQVLGEWIAYAELESSPDWDDLDDD